jgi:hypothetical protein
MITIICIGVVTALVAFAVVLKVWAREPKKAQKAEKAAIMKQLLALSESENAVPLVAHSRPQSQTGTRRAKAGKPRRKLAPNPLMGSSHPVRPSQGRC